MRTVVFEPGAALLVRLSPSGQKDGQNPSVSRKSVPTVLGAAKKRQAKVARGDRTLLKLRPG
jgi:hypothetical protein